MNKNSTKPRRVDFHKIPSKLWRKLKKHLPKSSKKIGPGRPRVDNRDVINGIWYVLWSGCQWKSVKRDWFQVSSSTLHERFQTWQQAGIFDQLFKMMVRYYARVQNIGWKWQSVDSKMVSSPLGGGKTGKNPTDRGKRGAKIHLLVDERGAPLAIHITGANEHDKWFVEDLVIQIVIKRPNFEQHFVRIKGMTRKIFSSLSKRTAMNLTSNIVVGGMSPKLRTVQFQAKRVIRPDAGSLKGL